MIVERLFAGGLVIPNSAFLSRHFHGSPYDFSAVTAFFGRRLALSLNGVAGGESDRARPASAVELGEAAELVLWAGDGEVTADAGLLFAPANNTTHWHFYERRHFDPATRRADLMYIGNVSASIEPRAFIVAAYSLILERSPDEGGLHHYTEVLSREAGQRRLLGILAASREARALKRFLVILPAPSRFIPQTILYEQERMDRVAAVLAE